MCDCGGVCVEWQCVYMYYVLLVVGLMLAGVYVLVMCMVCGCM